jgi:hypothetical protein
MSEDVPEYNKKELKFVRLKNTYDDLVGYVTYGTEHIVIEMPLRIEIETLFEEGRQILSLQEYLPQSVVTIREIEISMNEIMFVTPVREEFNEQYEYVSDFFYNNESKLKKPKATIPKRESITETTEKVVSILEAMVNKKDKPVH